jgi:NTP pyrophosphatase (non-canonical NTP hydrolase)
MQFNQTNNNQGDVNNRVGGSSVLTFEELGLANFRRAKQWNKEGRNVPLGFALLELAGEVGEACNIGKKLARTELGLVGGTKDFGPLINELADVIICTDLVARKIGQEIGNPLGIHLGEAVARKFNATSRKHGFSVFLPE